MKKTNMTVWLELGAALLAGTAGAMMLPRACKSPEQTAYKETLATISQHVRDVINGKEGSAVPRIRRASVIHEICKQDAWNAVKRCLAIGSGNCGLEEPRVYDNCVKFQTDDIEKRGGQVTTPEKCFFEAQSQNRWCIRTDKNPARCKELVLQAVFRTCMGEAGEDA